MLPLEVAGLSIVFNPDGGLLDDLAIERGGRRIRPLHRAPWIDTPGDVPAGSAPHLRRLAGDFFCAPFATSDLENAPSHGWAANGRWLLHESRADSAGVLRTTLELEQTILGARLRKELTLRPGHPVIYQRHTFVGGGGALPVAHHAMIRAPHGARLSFSRKAFCATPAQPPETDPHRGRSILAYPQRADSLAVLKLAAGDVVDARSYPFASAHEDFLTLFDPSTQRIGWSAALAATDGFLFFAIKDATTLCQTSLWMSNGGRFYAPWLSRHTAVLGIEECCTYFGEGHRASIAENELTRAGIRTSLRLDPHGETHVRYACGAIPVPPNWVEVADIAVGDGRTTIFDVSGEHVDVPFDGRFFAEV